MAILPQPYLFDWQHVDAASDLDRLRLVLSAIPDGDLMLQLEALRANGRDDYPVRAVWNSILAGVVFQHPTIAALCRDLSRNGELRKVCGFDPRLGKAAVPTDSAYSHFLSSLLELEPMIRAMFHTLVEKLKAHVPDLGRFLSIDGKALPSFCSKGPKKKEDADDSKPEEQKLASNSTATTTADEPGNQEQVAKPTLKESDKDHRRENDADWGVKTYRGKRKDGTAWEKITKWFGFELHLLVDSQHEMPVYYQVTVASADETTKLLPLVQETKDLHPAVVASCEQLSADKGYDSETNIVGLWQGHGIRPIIDKRSDWKGPADETRLVFPDVVDTTVYDVKGQVKCVCPATGEVRPMTFWGFEEDRESLKYRCPAVANGFECKGRANCPGANGAYGKVVRIPLAIAPRMFTPLPRDSKAWDRAYDRRTASERVNSRIDQVLGFERHTIRGLKKMEARVGIALVVLLSMAVGRIEAGQKAQMRSLLAPAPHLAALAT